MVQTITPPEDDSLPPAVPARSRRPSVADAAHREVVRQRREHEASLIVGDTQDEGSERLARRRAHKAKLAPQPLFSRPRGVVLTPESVDAVADAVAPEFDGALEEPTADMESDNADA